MNASSTTRRGTRAVIAVVVALVVSLAGAVVPQRANAADIVPAGTADDLLVTYVARVCATYPDIMANKARNNLMESLRDLGPDSNYASNGIVNPTSEQSGTPGCAPVTGWRFALGTGIAGKSPGTLNLSIVTGAYPTSIVTTPSTPLLDVNGNPTGQNIAGAVTVALSSAQRDRISSGQQLWAQGGTPAQPLNGLQTTYGFGALRCAQDALNGDNVEYISFPKSQRHVFCYYYMVTPPPEAGTVIVRKQLAPGTNGSGQFRFDGNISYADNNGDGVNDFFLTATAATPGAITFIRGAVGAADPPWTFNEIPTPGWNPPTAPVCTTNLGSPITVDPTTLEVSVQLRGNDVVTCTYTNSRILTGPQQLWKQTVGALGTFPFQIDVPSPNPDISTSVTTVTEGVPALVASGFGSIPGTYVVTETLPADTAAGSWELLSAECDGTAIPITANGQQRTGSRTIGAGESADCLVTNQFTPGGSISIQKTTVGGVGQFGFDVEPLGLAGAPRGTSYRLEATTSAENLPAAATPIGPPPDDLMVDPATDYLIQEVLPPIDFDGFWRMIDVDCGANPAVPDLDAASVVVTLSTVAPDAVCLFTNEFVAAGTAVFSKESTDNTALRPGSAQLVISCSDGTDIPLVVPAGDTGASTPNYAVFADLDCTVTEPANGAAPGVTDSKTATIAIDGAAPVPLPAPYTFSVGPGTEVAVILTDVLSQGGTGGNGVLPATGVPTWWGWLGLGALLTALAGAGLLLLSRRRRATLGR